MNKFIIINFLRTLNVTTAKKYLQKLNFNFSGEEIRIILPYLQNNASSLLCENDIKKRIHRDLEGSIDMDSRNKLIDLLIKLGII